MAEVCCFKSTNTISPIRAAQPESARCSGVTGCSQEGCCTNVHGQMCASILALTAQLNIDVTEPCIASLSFAEDCEPVQHIVKSCPNTPSPPTNENTLLPCDASGEKTASTHVANVDHQVATPSQQFLDCPSEAEPNLCFNQVGKEVDCSLANDEYCPQSYFATAQPVDQIKNICLACGAEDKTKKTGTLNYSEINCGDAHIYASIDFPSNDAEEVSTQTSTRDLCYKNGPLPFGLRKIASRLRWQSSKLSQSATTHNLKHVPSKSGNRTSAPARLVGVWTTRHSDFSGSLSSMSDLSSNGTSKSALNDIHSGSLSRSGSDSDMSVYCRPLPTLPVKGGLISGEGLTNSSSIDATEQLHNPESDTFIYANIANIMHCSHQCRPSTCSSNVAIRVPDSSDCVKMANEMATLTEDIHDVTSDYDNGADWALARLKNQGVTGIAASTAEECEASQSSFISTTQEVSIGISNRLYSNASKIRLSSEREKFRNGHSLESNNKSADTHDSQTTTSLGKARQCDKGTVNCHCAVADSHCDSMVMCKCTNKERFYETSGDPTISSCTNTSTCTDTLVELGSIEEEMLDGSEKTFQGLDLEKFDSAVSQPLEGSDTLADMAWPEAAIGPTALLIEPNYANTGASTACDLPAGCLVSARMRRKMSRICHNAH